MHTSQSLFNLTTALHVSGVTITHLQEHKTIVTTASGNRYTVLLSAAIVEELEPVWVCCGWRIYIYIYIYIYICSYYSLWEWKNFTWLALLSSGLIPLNTVLFVKVTVAWIFAKSPTLFLGAESITFPCSQGSATGPNYESDETTPHHYVGHLHSTLSLFSTYIKVVHAINSLGGFWLKLFSQSRSSHSCYVTSPCWFVYCNNTYFFFCCGAATQRGTWPPHSWGF